MATGEPGGTVRGIAGFLVRYRTALLVVAILLLGTGLAFTKFPGFTGSLRGFDLRDDPFYATKLHVDSIFGGGSTVYITITPTSSDLGEVISGVRELEARIASAYPDASFISFPTYYQRLHGPAFQSATIERFLESAAQTPLLKELVGRDRRSFLLLVRFGGEARLDVSEFTEVISGEYPGIATPEALSLSHIEESIRQHVVRDFATLTLSVVLVFVLLFAYVYRRAGAVLFAATNILVSVLASLFFISILDVELNLVTILVVPIVVVLSLADSVHLLTGYATSEIEDPDERLKHVLSLYLVPSFHTSLTTAVAFFTFYLYSDSAFIRDFGLVTSLALLAEFFLTFMVSPLLLKSIDVRRLYGFRITAASAFLQSRHQPISAFFLVVLVGSVFLVPRLEFSTSTHIFFPRGSNVERAHDRFNDQYYSQIDLEILVAGRGQRDGESAREHLDLYVQELSAVLASEPHVTSVTTALDRVSVYAVLPLAVPLRQLLGPENPYFRESENVHRIVVTFPDADMIRSFYDGPFTRLRSEAPEHVSLSATSTALVMDSVNRSVAGSLVRSLLTAAVAVLVMVLLMTRSVLLSLLCLIPNLVPLGVVTIVFVVFDVDINILTAITAVICLGLLADDTIHILYRKVTLRSALGEVSFSILSTSIILVLGFAIFCMSSFRPVQTFGAISAVVFLFGVASDLTLMPAVIDRWFAFNRARKGVAEPCRAS